MVKKILGYSYIYLILLLLYLPIFVLIVFSFTAGTNLGDFSQGFSFDLYKDLFKDYDLLRAFGNTVLVAVISAAVSTLIGTLGAIGTFYSRKRTKRVVESINQIPVVNAEIVLALSLTVMFVFLGSEVFKGSLFGFFTLLVGHCVLCIPFVYLNVKPKLVQMDPQMYEAALDLGATPSKALRKIVIPQILPGITSGFLLSISLSLDDFIVTAFTRGPGLLNGDGQIETLSTYVQAKIKKGPIPPDLRALTTLLFVLILIVVVVLTIRKNRQAKKASQIRRRGI